MSDDGVDPAFLDHPVAAKGFKRERIPKLEVYRAQAGAPLLDPHDADIVAIASDQRLDTRLPRFHLDDHTAITDSVLRHQGARLKRSRRRRRRPLTDAR